MRNTEEKEEKKEKVENITEIAEKRKLSLDFDLEIQGNKKSIRVKDVPNFKPSKKKQIILDELEQAGMYSPDTRSDLNTTYNF